MQMYPKEGGYKEHYYAAVEKDYVVKDDCNYHRYSSVQMMKPDQYKKHGCDEKQGYGGCNDHRKDRDSYAEHWREGEYRGDYWNKKNDYYGHDGKEGDYRGEFWNKKNDYSGHGAKEGDYRGEPWNKKEGDYRGEPWNKKEGDYRGEPWNKKNDYSGHGGKDYDAHEYTHNAGMKHGGYEAHEGYRAPPGEHYQFFEGAEEKMKRVPYWEFKGIRG